MDFLFHEKLFCFIPYLKDFVLVNKISHLTSSYSSFGRVFQTYYIFKPIFENPYLPWENGWEIMFMYALKWKSFKTWTMIGRYCNMMYTLELIVMSIGIIELFQLVSFWSSCILIFVLYVCMLSFQVLVSIFIHICLCLC